MIWIKNNSITGTWKCSKCRHLVPDNGYMYCPHCGEQTDEPPFARIIKERWTPVVDGLPEDSEGHKRYLVTFRKNGKTEVHIAFYEDTGWFWHIGSPCEYEITAWAPLPRGYITLKDIYEEDEKDD